MKEKIITLQSHIFILMSCYRYLCFKAHKLYEQSIIISLDITKGLFSFELINLTTEERIKMDNPEKGTYEYPLKRKTNIN